MLELQTVFGLKTKLSKKINAKGLKLRNPKISSYEGKKTVLSLCDGKNFLGILKTKNERQSKKYTGASNATLKLKYDDKRTRHIFLEV